MTRRRFLLWIGSRYRLLFELASGVGVLEVDDLGNGLGIVIKRVL